MKVQLLLLMGLCIILKVTIALAQTEIHGEVKKLPKHITGKDGVSMVLIPAGEFQMGSSNGDDDEKPIHTVYVDALYMDKYEVANAQYRKFIEATGHREPGRWNDFRFNQANQPVVGVSWHDAMAYAQWAGKHLPTEAEWEKAARGGLKGTMYPWGDSIDLIHKSKANYGNIVGRTTLVGKYALNGYGLYDMTGNVWEWCLDKYDSNFYSKSPKRNPFSGGSIASVISNFTNIITSRVLRGGSWVSPSNSMRVANREGSNPTYSYDGFGFRCVMRPSEPSGNGD